MKWNVSISHPQDKSHDEFSNPMMAEVMFSAESRSMRIISDDELLVSLPALIRMDAQGMVFEGFLSKDGRHLPVTIALTASIELEVDGIHGESIPTEGSNAIDHAYAGEASNQDTSILTSVSSGGDSDTNLELLTELFENKIKGKTFEYERSHDGSEGIFLETLFDKKADNLSVADWNGIELKTQKKSSGSLLTLVSKTPINGNVLRQRYGKIAYDKNGAPYHRLNATISATQFTQTKSNRYNFKVVCDDVNKKIFIEIKDATTGYIHKDVDVFWSYEDIEKIISKLKNVALFSCDVSINDSGKNEIVYSQFEILHLDDLSDFIDLINKGIIKIDIRMGMYQSGKKIGQLHDHGTAFRINMKAYRSMTASLTNNVV